MKMGQVGAELFRADGWKFGQTDKHDELRVAFAIFLTRLKIVSAAHKKYLLLRLYGYQSKQRLFSCTKLTYWSLLLKTSAFTEPCEINIYIMTVHFLP